MRIDAFSFGSITVNGRQYHNDVILFPDSISRNWLRKQGHVLALEDLKDILRYKPDILVVGTGTYGSMSIPSSIKIELGEKGIELIESPTDEACKFFNSCMKQEKKVVGAFHLTC